MVKFKIALCLYGQTRTFLNTFNNIKKNVIGLNDVDIFIHTWSSDMDDKIIDLCNPISIKIEPDKNFINYKNIDIEKLYSDDLYNNVLPQIYSINEVRKLKIDYENKFNFKYDYVVKMRMDILLNKPFDYNMFNPEFYYFCKCHWDGFFILDDNISIQNSKNFDDLYNMWDYKNLYFNLSGLEYYKPFGRTLFFGEGCLNYFIDMKNIRNKCIRTEALDYNILRK